MVNVVTAYNNFARAKVDHDMMGRFDLPIYNTSADIFKNCISNFKGNAIYRTGFQDMIGAFQDCRLHEFKFTNDQNYILVFYNTKIRFLTYDSNGDFGWVLSGGSPLEVTTPYSLAQSKELQLTQNGDVMIITHQSHAPRSLTRVSASSFTLATFTLTGIVLPASEWPKCCLFYKNRLYLANTATKPTTIWASEAGDFNKFTVGTSDIAPLQFTIADISQPIEWLFGGENSLIAGSADAPVAINGGGVGSAITASTIEADLTSGDGTDDTIPLKKDSFIFYVGKNGRNVYYFSYDLLTESFLSKDANFISYDITKSNLSKIRHKKDRDDLIFGLRNDGALLSLNFKESENIIGWHEHDTEGSFKDIVVITDNEGNPQLFSLVLRGSSYFIEKMANRVEFSQRANFFTGDKSADNEAYARKVAEELNECIYLDNALTFNNLQTANTITYDSGAGTITDTDGVFVSGDVGKHISYKTSTGYESGRFEITGYTDANTVVVEVLQTPSQNTWDDWYLSFNTLSGLSQYNGETIYVVTDGGFLSTFDVSGGEIEFNQEVLNVVVGYRYIGEIKSFNLGFQVKAENTQTTMKAISRVGMRCVSSSGVKFGTDRYRIEPLQQLTQGDFNYLPPLPIDGTKYLTYADDNEIDKYFYVVQDEPLPMTLTTVMIECNYTVRF